MSAPTKHPHDCWIVDKRLALTVIMFLVVQLGTIIWWAAVTDAGVKENTRRIEKMEQIVEQIPAMGQDVKWLRKFLEKQSDK